MSKPKNPLGTFWNYLGTIGGIFALANMTQSWFDSLIAWKGFLAGVFNAYQSVTAPIKWFLLDFLLPFNLPYWVGDYLIFGVIFATSFKIVMGHMIPADKNLIKIGEESGLSVQQFMFLKNMVTMTIVPIIWPLTIFVLLRDIFRSEAETTKTHKGEKGGHRTIKELNILVLQWLGAILLGVVVLLSINAIMVT